MSRWIGNALAAALVGIAVAVLAFPLSTVGRPERLPVLSSSDNVRIVTWPGFDPWTGNPHGVTFSTTDEAGQTVVHERPQFAPDGHAIPLPVGFAVGFVGTLAVLFVARPRRVTPLHATA